MSVTVENTYHHSSDTNTYVTTVNHEPRSLGLYTGGIGKEQENKQVTKQNNKY